MNLNFLIVSICACNFVQMACVILEHKDPYPVKNGELITDEPRKKQQQDVFSRILPMLASPFILQTTLLPMMIMSMKFMLLNSMFLGKLGIFLWIINLIRNRLNGGGALYSHNVNIKHNDYPGHFNTVNKHVLSEHYGDAEDKVFQAVAHKRKKRKLF